MHLQKHSQGPHLPAVMCVSSGPPPGSRWAVVSGGDAEQGSGEHTTAGPPPTRLGSDVEDSLLDEGQAQQKCT